MLLECSGRNSKVLECRRMGDILTQYEEFASEHAAQGTDFTARMVALQEAHQSTTEDVGTRLLRLDKITRVVEEVDVRGVHERVHGLVRQFDETDIFVKHLQNKVCMDLAPNSNVASEQCVVSGHIRSGFS